MSKLLKNEKEEDRKEKLRQIKLEKQQKKLEKYKQTDESKKKQYIAQLEDFLDSPFENDQRFCLVHLSQLSRDDLEGNEDVI
jgi:hypothetical protein